LGPTGPSGIANLLVQPTPPDTTDLFWFDDATGYLSVKVNGSWINISSSGPQGATGNTGPTGPQGSTGADGKSVTLLGSKPDVGSLPATGNTIGNGWIIGTNLYVWDGVVWNNVGAIQGPQGIQGIQGSTGPQGIQGPTGATPITLLLEEW
jgi:hypothetical protein